MSKRFNKKKRKKEYEKKSIKLSKKLFFNEKIKKDSIEGRGDGCRMQEKKGVSRKKIKKNW